MALLRLTAILAWTVVVALLPSVSAVYKGLPVGDQVDMREAVIGRVYSDELSSKTMIHYVYPIQDLSKRLSYVF